MGHGALSNCIAHGSWDFIAEGAPLLAASLEVPSLGGVGLQTRWIMDGVVQLSEVMARLQLATAAIATAKAVGMDGDLDDPESS